MTFGPPWRDAAEVLSRPDGDPRRPWVLAAGDLVAKAYDLRAFEDEFDRSRLREEADTAVALSDIRDVVTTLRVEEVDEWLVIEMERLGHPLAAYLDPGRAGALPPISSERWGALFEQVANALEEIHRRHLTHHDVKPANLLFDRAGERLVVADFSVSAKHARIGKRSDDAQVRGTPRYIAPELFAGRSGPKVDQFALGMTASDVLGDGLPRAATLALLRATSHEPEERFARISDFGTALRSALDDKAPRRLSSRLQTVSAEWRHAWGPAVAMAVAAYLAIAYARNPDVTIVESIGVPLILGLATLAVLRLLTSKLGRRTQPRVAIADRAWFPVAVAAGLIAAFWPLINDNPRSNGKYVIYALGAALLLTATLGSVHRDAGGWLIGLVNRWERAGWPARIAVVSLLGGALVAPSLVTDRWPRQPAAEARVGGEAIVVVAQFREALLDGDFERACAIVSAPSSPDVAPCGTWAPVAARRLRDEVRAGGPRFVPGELERVRAQYLPRSVEEGGPRLWALRTDGDDREYLGVVSRPVDSESFWLVSVTRSRDRTAQRFDRISEWRYEVARRGGRVTVTAVLACDTDAAETCLTVSQLSRAGLDAYAGGGAS